jgi:resuscitation-promoting factor RpfB
MAFANYDKTVTVSVDGESHTTHTFAGTVSEVLEREGVQLGEHDIVAPGPSSPIGDGTRIAVRYGRPLNLTIDGYNRQVWVTATNVGEAMAQLGVRADGAHLSTSRMKSIGRNGMALNIRTERKLTVLADGAAIPVTTNAATVREAIDRAGVLLGPQDRATVPLDAYPANHSTISVLRVDGTEYSEDEKIPFEVKREEDPTLFKGTEKVVTKGEVGLKRAHYAVEVVNGERQEPQLTSSTVLKEPVTQIVRYGTKELPTSVSRADHLNWSALARCESSGNAQAVDPSGHYHGLYQFDPRTWASVGGSGLPSMASRSEQTYRAKLLYTRRGDSAWPLCGKRLYS